MVVLDRIVLREVRMPLRSPFRSASGVEHGRRVILLELFDADGAVAWSECVGMEAPTYLPETIDTALFALREWFIPAALGRPFSTPESVFEALARGVRGHRMALASVEMGVWTLFSEKARRPLAAQLGGTRRKVAAGVALGIQTSEATLRDLLSRIAGEGYRRTKLKIQPGADVSILAAARDVLGPEALLMADANSAYTLEDVNTFLAIDAFGLLMIEQPLAWDDFVRHADLQRRIRTPICLDESLLSPGHVEVMARLGAGRIVNLKAGRVGGFSQAIQIHDFCRAHRIPLWCGGMLETGIGRAYNVALASLLHFELPGDLSPSARYWDHDIVHPEWTMSEDGYIAVPDGPGLGVEVDRDRIDRLTVAKETFTARHLA